MAEPRNLRNPPIFEAVVDISAVFSAEPPSAGLLDTYASHIAAAYPTKEARLSFTVKLGHGDPDSSVEPAGVLLRNEDRTRAIQAKPDGFSFSQLKPYTNWEATTQETWKYWQAYVDVCAPVRIRRLSTRFINRLEFAGPELDFDDYLLIGPRMPQGAPDYLSAFHCAMTIPDIAPHTTALVRCIYDSNASAPAVTVLLDIDIVRECDLDSRSSREILEALNALRPLKNRMFFGSLTEKAIEGFD